MIPLDPERTGQETAPSQPIDPNASQPMPAGNAAPKRNKMTFRLVAFVVLGALGGLAYYKFIGCRSGTCPITSNPYISTAYGAVIGYFLSGGWS
jgi:hypothetical protein